MVAHMLQYYDIYYIYMITHDICYDVYIINDIFCNIY